MQNENWKLGMKSLFVYFLLLNSPLVFGQDDILSKESASLNSIDNSKLYVIENRAHSIQRNTLYLELAGSGGFGSFNFEWNFASREKINWMLRTGISGTHIDKNNGSALIFPVMVHGIYGEKHCLDVGIGQSLSVTTKGGFFVRAPISLGYRLEPKEKRIFYRFSYTPIVSYLVDFQWEHWAGISIGYKLKPRYIW